MVKFIDAVIEPPEFDEAVCGTNVIEGMLITSIWVVVCVICIDILLVLRVDVYADLTNVAVSVFASDGGFDVINSVLSSVSGLVVDTKSTDGSDMVFLPACMCVAFSGPKV